MKKYLAATLLTTFLAFTPAHAANELQNETISELTQKIDKYHGKIEKLSPADVAKSDAIAPRPDKYKDTDIYLMFNGAAAIILIVKGDKILFSTNPVAMTEVNNVLGRGGI
jgi:hypothetical protein